ncbi:MAG TPA: DNA translocase FtsK 4TM domain-containing protein, partial [Fimbriimonadaceae bacterium]|nr:DNA translocase FtsK 4TM domain-containing protein [Fimbriimonadaceae bacterium]
ALGAITAIALWTSNAGIFGSALGNVFRTLFGLGSWGIVGVFALMGTGLLAGRRAKGAAQLGWGLILLFITVLGSLARATNGDFFDPTIASDSGGYVGAIVAWVLDSLLGAAKPVGLGALGMVGLILCLQMPIRAVVETLADRANDARQKRKSVKPAEKAPVKAVVRTPFRETIREEKEEPAPLPRKKIEPIVREAPTLSTGNQDSTPKEGYQLPSMALLAPANVKQKRTAQEMQANIETLEGTLEEFGIDANVVEVAGGPTITRYEIQLGPGVRVARITALADNIAMNLAASHVRVEAPIPGKAAIGVEVPNATPTPVSLREVADSKEFQDHPSRLIVCLGQDVSGVNRYADLTKMPHLLIGGATNSGKSIGLASIIMSLLIRNTPKDVRLVMIDPKRVELTFFDQIPHLLCPVVKDVKEAPGVLRAVWREMDRRYDVFSEAGVRNIDGWNEKASFQDKMSYIVVVIDELADLMIQAAAEVETSICRLAQLARATGIHLVIATQRPSVDVITGTIKANIASRIAFTVSSQIDSRTILDQAGAERLIGRGDMLFMPIDASKPLRIQGCYVSEKEIQNVCNFWREQEKPSYVLTPVQDSSNRSDPSDSSDSESDTLWEESVRWVVDRGQASTSMLQRRFSIGFQRASRLLDVMEERGIVGPRDGPRPREVLIDPMEVDSLFGGNTRSPHADLIPELREE